MRVIGIDPGIERTGFAVLEQDKNGAPQLLDYGCIYTSKEDEFPARLASLAADIRSLLRQWKPTAAGIEQLFFSTNVKTAMRVSQARGVVVELLEEHGVPIMEINPSHIKMAVTGSGRADKVQVRKMLHYLLGVSPKNDDSADAIACGICLLSSLKLTANPTPQPR